MKSILCFLLALSTAWAAHADGNTDYPQDALGLGLPIVQRDNFQLPPVRSDLLSVSIDIDERHAIETRGYWQKIDFKSLLDQKLRSMGIDVRSNNSYEIQSISVLSKSRQGDGQIRLCQIGSDPRNSDCELVLSNYQLLGSPKNFNKNKGWKSYPLFQGMRGLSSPFLEIEVLGNVKIKAIEVTLLVHGQVPVAPPTNLPKYNNAKIIMTYTGGPTFLNSFKNDPTLEKMINGDVTVRNFFENNIFYEGYGWINITSLENQSVVRKVSYKCIDHRGDERNYEAQTSLGHSIRDRFLDLGTSLTFQIDRTCDLLESVQVSGFSPNARGSRARIEVVLN